MNIFNVMNFVRACDERDENYPVDAFCICHDEVNTDAYTLICGYFNGAYYPSKNNMFSPTQTKENQVKTPVFRILV